MRCARISAITVAVLLFAPAGATATRFLLFPFDPNLSLFVQSYHQHPQPKAALDRFFAIDIESFEKDALSAQQLHSRAVLMAFFAHVLHANPSLVLPFAEQLVANATGSKAAFGSEAIAYGASSSRADALELIAERFALAQEHRASLTNAAEFPYPQMKAANWQDLDILWACFFASGDRTYIRAIVEPLNRFAVPEDTWMQRAEQLTNSPPGKDSPEYAEWIDF